MSALYRLTMNTIEHAKDSKSLAETKKKIGFLYMYNMFEESEYLDLMAAVTAKEAELAAKVNRP